MYGAQEYFLLFYSVDLTLREQYSSWEHVVCLKLLELVQLGTLPGNSTILNVIIL